MPDFEQTYRDALIARGVIKPDAKRANKRGANHVHARPAAEGDDTLTCPSCGYTGPESDFDESDDKSDDYRTDDQTIETGDRALAAAERIMATGNRMNGDDDDEPAEPGDDAGRG